MEALWAYHERLLKHVQRSFVRYLEQEINWEARMLAIKGSRGVGKTTLMLQHLKDTHDQPGEALYVTADYHWFYTHTLVDTAQEFYQNGGRYLYIDEIHKYPNWSRELKNIYDLFPGMQVVFSSSSALDIYQGESDLSRRVITYELPGMSFREYLNFIGKGHFPRITLNDLVKDHMEVARQVTSQFHPLPYFRQYLQSGYFPIIGEIKEEEVPLVLAQTINTVLETDLAFIENYTPSTAYKVKKLLGVLAESVPFKPNFAALARKLDVSRDSIYAWFTHLEKARLINLLHSATKGVSLLQKPDKVYLENTNLAYALKNTPNVGSLRETFLLNQLINSGQPTAMPQSGDFVVNDEFIVEVGGKDKNRSQIKNLENGIIAADDIEIGFARKIPLWLFGFLY